MNERLEEIKKELLQCETMQAMDAVNRQYDVEADELLALADDPEIGEHLLAVTGGKDWAPQ